jgi:hypothetical protein
MTEPVFRKPSIKVFKGSSKKNWLIIPDSHLGEEHPKALEFLINVKELYNIPDSNVCQLGDFLDLWSFSRYPKGGDYPVTPRQEIEIARKKVREWARAFPLLKLCVGNHERRLWQRAIDASLPTDVIRSVREIFEYPKEWDVEECYVTNTKHPFLLIHGDGEGVSNTNPIATIKHFGISAAWGHFHSRPSVSHIDTLTQKLWGMSCGAIVNKESFCFKYGEKAAHKISNGCGVVLGEGSFPIFIPMPD